MPLRVNHHASAVILTPEPPLDYQVFLLEQKVDYPLPAFDGAFCLYGGNWSAPDTGPQDTLIRELTEEFSSEVQEDPRELEKLLDGRLAEGENPGAGIPSHPPVPPEFLTRFRDHLLSRVTFVETYHVHASEAVARKDVAFLYSIFEAQLDLDLFYQMEGYVLHNYALGGPGRMSVVTLHDLLRGKDHGLQEAWGAFQIIADQVDQRAEPPLEKS